MNFPAPLGTVDDSPTFAAQDTYADDDGDEMQDSRPRKKF